MPKDLATAKMVAESSEQDSASAFRRLGLRVLAGLQIDAR